MIQNILANTNRPRMMANNNSSRKVQYQYENVKVGTMTVVPLRYSRYAAICDQALMSLTLSFPSTGLRANSL